MSLFAKSTGFDKSADFSKNEATSGKGRTLGLNLMAASILLANGALAQEAPTSRVPTASLEEIIVTAQRREESIQDTPIALSVMSDEDLIRASVVDISDLSGRIPGLVVGGKLTGGGNQSISIRGVTGQSVLTGADTAVSIYLDGVYLSKPDAAFFSLADVERVEILRGPQGTLYGRNATAGAINIITRNPSSESWSGSLDASYGNYDTFTGKAYIGGPLGDRFSGSLSVAAVNRDGYYDNSATGDDVSPSDKITARAKLRFLSEDERLDAVLSYDRTDEDSPVGLFHFGYNEGPLGSPFQYFGISDPDESYIDWQDKSFGDYLSEGAGLTINYELSDEWTLTSVSGWRELSLDTGYSITPPGGFPLLTNIFGGGVTPMMIQSLNESDYGPALSQELRAVYQGERLKFTGGFTYFEEDVRSHFGGVIAPLDSPKGNLSNTATAPVVETEVQSYAVFAQADWEFAENWTATLGLRQNHEKRQMDEKFPAIPGVPTLTSEVDDDELITRYGLQYQPNDNWLFFATIAEGYQAPGQSYSANPPPTGVILEVAPEELTSYEVGFKSEWMEGRLRFNATAFFYDYDPSQVRITTGLNQFRIVNATSEVQGVEIEFAYAVTPELTITGNALSLDSEYTELCNNQVPFDKPLDCQLPGTTGTANNGVSRKGNPLSQAPETQVNLGFNYERFLDNGNTFTLDGSYSYQSEVYFAPDANRYSRGDAYERVNLRAGLKFSNDLEVYAFGNNLTDDQTQAGLIYTALVGNVLDAGQITPPRTYGLGVRYTFE